MGKKRAKLIYPDGPLVQSDLERLDKTHLLQACGEKGLGIEGSRLDLIVRQNYPVRPLSFQSHDPDPIQTRSRPSWPFREEKPFSALPPVSSVK